MLTDPLSYPEPFSLGGHLAMDFLNSIEKPHIPATECLRDGVGLVRWLHLIGAIGEHDAARLYAFDREELDHAAERARGLREWFRELLARQRAEGASKLPAAALWPLETLLAEGQWFFQVEDGVSQEGEVAQPVLAEKVRWTSAAQALQPIARAIADLLVREDLMRVKHCVGNGCSILFLDRTKANKRRWCSMALCGNRAKSATHRARATALS
jgi:predicted RNA-binding Zn ribbon-like protein